MAVPPIITISSSSAASTQAKPASSHRLPTQSAAEALQDIERGSAHAFISTGLKSLDLGLTGNSPGLVEAGLERGKVAEVWGPPGGGKTSIAFQAACEAIKDEGAVVWIDCATLLGATRLRSLDPSSSPEDSKSPTSDDKQKEMPSDRFHYLSMPTLSHLLAQIIHPSENFPPPQTSLLVIDGINTLLDLDFPRTGYSLSNRSEAQKWQANRRYSILGSLISALNKLAVLHDLAVLVTTGCNSKMRPGEGAAIGPGVGGSEWEAGTHTRTVVFRDFSGRYAGVQKVNGRNLMPLDPMSDVRNIIGFEIEGHGGLRERVVDLTGSSAPAVDGGKDGGVLRAVQGQEKKVAIEQNVVARKRVYDEIADSEEDEDVDEYGWVERDDEDVIIVDPPPPPPPADVEVVKDIAEEQVVEETLPVR